MGRVIFVELKYRKNPLAKTPGGAHVIVTFKTGDTRIYERCKRPKAYCDKAIHNGSKFIDNIVINNRDGKGFELYWTHIDQKEVVSEKRASVI